jgi:hypothetical protein
MAITDIMKNVLNTSWTWTDDFDFFFQNNKVKFPTDINPKEAWEMCVTNIDLPQVSTNIETLVIAQKHRAWIPIHDTFTFTINFRDFEKMKLKEYFTQIWKLQQSEYYNDIKSVVKIEAGKGIMFESQDVLIQNVSTSQLDNANTQILEFSVEFVSLKYSNNTIKNFDGYEGE